MTVELARLDTAATAAAGRYDPDFKTLVPGTKRVEISPNVRLLAQVEMGRWEGQQQLQAGNAPDSRLTLVFHFSELEEKGLVDAASGHAKINVGDRLVGIWDRTGALLEQLVRAEAGGLYATEVQPAGIGLGGRRNLLVVVFDERTPGLQTNP